MPSVLKLAFYVCLVLLAHAFAVAYSNRQFLHDDVHDAAALSGKATSTSGLTAVSRFFPMISDTYLNSLEGSESTEANAAAAASLHSLPMWVVAEVLVASIGAVVCYTLDLQKRMVLIRRKEVAGTAGRFDSATFTGLDFVHYNHR